MSHHQMGWDELWSLFDYILSLLIILVSVGEGAAWCVAPNWASVDAETMENKIVCMCDFNRHQNHY